MYRVSVEIEGPRTNRIGEYNIKDKHLDTILKFCESTNYKVIGIKKF